MAMKKILAAAAALLTALALLAGCGSEKTAEAGIEGKWLSGDGSVLTISEGNLTLTDSMGGSLLAQPSLPCDHRGDFLYVGIGGVEVKMFEAAVDGDTLTLRYTMEIQSDMQTICDDTITLTREDG